MDPTLCSTGPAGFDASAAPALRVAFDIELASIIELAPGEDLARHAPFDIACAAATDERGGVWHWFARDAAGRPCGKLDVGLARGMLRWLREHQQRGTKVCAWNGLSFDLQWLGHVADDFELAREVALELYDPMFQFFVRRGFPVSLASVAQAMGVGEAKLMDGAEAPKCWARGEHQLVLDYVAGDCRITESVVARIERERAVRWRTKQGKLSSEPMPELLPVRALLGLPPPDTSWMRDPIPREKFTGWLAGA